MFTWKQDQEELAPPPRLDPSAPQPARPPAELFPSMQGPAPFGAFVGPTVTDGGALAGPGPFPGNELYVSAEALLWWIKGYRVPPLGTQFTDGAPTPGVFGSPGTQVVLGDTLHGTDARGGARIMIGYWFDDDHDFGLEGGGFFLGQRNQSSSVSSFGLTNLAVPVDMLTTTGTGGAIPIAGLFPPAVLRDVGSLSLNTKSSLAGGELNGRTNLLAGPNGFIDAIAGARVVSLDEQLTFGTTTSGVAEAALLGQLPGITFPGLTERITSDFFKTQNRFYGGQVGLIGEWHEGPWVFDLKSKIALGTTQQIVTINGATVDSSVAGGLHSYPVGLLASSSNSGRFTRDQTSFIPEFSCSLGYQFTERLRCFVGYNVLYWSSVVRPGDQINRVINPNQIPGFGTGITPGVGSPAQPAFAFHSSDFWAQGITLGLEWRF